MIIRKTPAEIDKMARAGSLSAATIAHVAEHLRPGVTTAELDSLAGEFIRSQGGVSTSKGYKGYPAEICISPNDVVVHGIPGSHLVEDGDLITIDVGTTLDGFIADSAFTFAVGTVDRETERLLEVGRDALTAGIERHSSGTGSAMCRTRCRSSSRQRDSRSCAASSGTASVATTTRIRTCRTSVFRAAGRDSRRG